MGVEAAIGGAAVVGGVTSLMGADKAADAQDRASQSQAASLAEQNRIADESLAYQKELRAQWDETYGTVERNLSDYYENLTPDRLTAQGVQATQESYQNTTKQLQQTLAQRGITGTGVEAQGLTNLAVSQARQEAQIKIDAPEQIAQQQSSFLNLGLNQRQSIDQGVERAYGTQQSVAGGEYKAATAQYNQAVSAEQAAYGSLGSVVGSAAGAYGTYKGLSS